MKKKLEAELISIAHRILKLKNKSELDQLYLETQKLYEKLAVLKFVEANFADVKPTIGRNQAEEILETAFDEKEEAPTDAETAAPVAEETNVAPNEIETQELPATDAPKAEISDEASDMSESTEQTVNAEDKPQPDEADKENDKEKDEQKEQEKIQEPSTPEEEKLAPDATPIEKEADEVIAEAEEAIANDGDSAQVTQGENTEEKQPQAPVTAAGIDFVQPETAGEVLAAVAETKPQEDLFKPAFEWAFDAKKENARAAESSDAVSSHVAFEDLLGAGYKDPIFVKPEDEIRGTIAPAEDTHIEPTRVAAQNEIKPGVIPITHREDKVPVFKMNSEGSINDRMSKGSITVGLNDRIAFVKNLFNNSNEDYNRVLSQMLTFDTFAEAQDFIANIVKPDYDNWENKEEFEMRFMEVIEKKFS